MSQQCCALASPIRFDSVTRETVPLVLDFVAVRWQRKSVPGIQPVCVWDVRVGGPMGQSQHC